MTNSKTIKQEPIVFAFMQEVANENEFCVVTDISEFIELEEAYNVIRNEVKSALMALKNDKISVFEFRVIWLGYRFAAKAYFKAFHETMAIYKDAMN